MLGLLAITGARTDNKAERKIAVFMVMMCASWKIRRNDLLKSILHERTQGLGENGANSCEETVICRV
jgi:hypothetical protein